MQETSVMILYIGDDADSAQALQRRLENKGYAFKQAKQGLDGIEMASRYKPDLILVDINLSDIDSSSFIARLRIIPYFKETPIIIVASHAQLDGRRLALISGCDGYLAKPIQSKQLFMQIVRFVGNPPDVNGQSDDPAETSHDCQQLEVRVKELLALNERLRHQNEQLQELDRRRAKFFSVVSHDLRTPFTPIRGYIDLVRDGAMGELNDKQQHALGIVTENLGNALRLLDDLLDLSKLQANGITLSMALFSIQELLDEVARNGKTYVEKNDVEFKVDLPPDLPLIQGDRGRIRQVVLNLLNNAAKFTDQGSITLAAIADEDHITIQIKDTGAGLLPEEIPQVFDKFWESETIRSSGLGTGLGLAISRHLVQAHHGEIWLESEKDVGTTVSFTIPVAKMKDKLPVGA